MLYGTIQTIYIDILVYGAKITSNGDSILVVSNESYDKGRIFIYLVDRVKGSIKYIGIKGCVNE